MQDMMDVIVRLSDVQNVGSDADADIMSIVQIYVHDAGNNLGAGAYTGKDKCDVQNADHVLGANADAECVEFDVQNATNIIPQK